MPFCEPRLARFKIPRFVRIVDSFPMTASGKIQKYKLREAHEAELSAAEPTEAAQCFSIFDGVSQVLPSFCETLPVTVAWISCVHASPAFSATSFLVM